MEKHFNIKITGKVQGVFFRASAKQKADELGVKGFARNEPDGSVYIEAETDNAELFIGWCRQGPPHAQVDQCDVHEAAVIGYKNFTIQR